MYVSRHHPVSSSAPNSHPGVSSKWSKKQDEKLKQAVQKYDTQWSLISRKYRFDRSVNSLVKRWHGKLKQEVQKGVSNKSQSNEEEKLKPETQKSKRIRKQKKVQQKKEKPKSRRGGYRRRNPKAQQLKKQTRDRSRSRKQSQPQKKQKQNEKKKMNVIEQESDNGSSKNRSQVKEVEVDSLDNSDQKFVFQHKWKDYEDKILKQMILNEHILNWQELANKLKIENIREVRKRWQHNVYPQIIEQRKIGGCLKYSEEQDAILNRGVKLGMTVLELRKFLPGRTQYSLEARRRRTLRMDEEQVPQLRYWTKKLLAYKFVEKRHQHLEKPTDENEFMYRSDSQ